MLTLVPLARTRSKISGKFRSSQINSRGLSVKKDSLYIGKIHPLLESSSTTTRGTQKEDLKVIWLSKWSFFSSSPSGGFPSLPQGNTRKYNF